MRGARKEGEPLDLGRRRIVGSGTLSPIVHSGVRRLSVDTFDIRSHEVPSVKVRVDAWQSHKVGPAWSTGGHALPGDRSRHSIEFSHLGVSRNRRVKSRWVNWRGYEVASREEPPREELGALIHELAR
jgi:hypothetical protein